MQVGFLGPLTCQFGHAGHRLALTFRLLHLALDGLGHLGVDVQVVVYLFLDKVGHILVDRLASRCHQRRPQLDLGLAFKHRFLHIDGDSRHQAVADIGIFVALVEKLLDGTGYMLLESALMRASLRGMLSVDETMVLLAILVGMGEGNLDIFALHVHDGV